MAPAPARRATNSIAPDGGVAGGADPAILAMSGQALRGGGPPSDHNFGPIAPMPDWLISELRPPPPQFKSLSGRSSANRSASPTPRCKASSTRWRKQGKAIATASCFGARAVSATWLPTANSAASKPPVRYRRSTTFPYRPDYRRARSPGRLTARWCADEQAI